MKIASGLFRSGLTPSFSSRLFGSDVVPSWTQGPGDIGVTPPPSAVRKNVRVPEEVCGRKASMGAFFPPTWSQLVSVHSKILVSWAVDRLAGASVPPAAAVLADQVTASPASATKAMPPGA